MPKVKTPPTKAALQRYMKRVTKAKKHVDATAAIMNDRDAAIVEMWESMTVPEQMAATGLSEGRLHQIKRANSQ